MIFGKVLERFVGGLRGCSAFVMLIVCVWVVLPVSGVEYATHNPLLQGEMWRGAFISNGENQFVTFADIKRRAFKGKVMPKLLYDALVQRRVRNSVNITRKSKATFCFCDVSWIKNHNILLIFGLFFYDNTNIIY